MKSLIIKIKYSIIFLALLILNNSCLGSFGSETTEKVKNTLPAISKSIKASQKKTSFALPTSLSLCGENIPLQNPGVYERLEYEFLLILAQPAQVKLWEKRAARYFPLIEQELKKSGLPDDLKYLAVAESDLRPTVVSHAGALGLWQFMPATAREFSLKVNAQQDERKLANHSLQAGQTFLQQLNNRFNNWALAMAAYNAGGGRISGAMRSQGVNSYYQLNLPRETERYVYRIAAIKAVMENSRAYNIKKEVPNNLYKPYAYTENNRTFEKATTWIELAKETKTEYKTLRMLNPHLKGASLSGGPYKIRLPKN